MIVSANKEAGQFTVMLNGADVSKDCYRADDEAGIVWCYSRDPEGEIFLDPLTGTAATSCLKGRVRLGKLGD